MSNSHTNDRAMPKKNGAPLPNCFARQADDLTGTMRWVIVIRWRQFHCGSSLNYLWAQTKTARKEVAEYIRAFRRDNRPDLNREYRAADCSEPFGEFLRRRWYTTY